MIISISGPTSTGKTTLIGKIKERGYIGNYKKIVIIHEVIRDIFKKEFLPKVGSMDDMMQNRETLLEWVESVGENSSQHIESEISKYDNDDTIIILDRCIIDHFIYAIIHTTKFSISLEEFYKVISKYNLSTKKIDYIFLTSVPENDVYDVDGMRPQAWSDGRSLENSLFQLIFGNFSIGLPYDIEERIKVIEDTLSN